MMKQLYGVDDVVMSLIGQVEPVGESHADANRYENLINLCDIHEAITQRLIEVATTHNMGQASMVKISNYAKSELTERALEIQEGLNNGRVEGE